MVYIAPSIGMSKNILIKIFFGYNRLLYLSQVQGGTMKRYKQYMIGIILLGIFVTVQYYVPKTDNTKSQVVASQFIETNSFSDLQKYIKPNSLVLIDIDDTLMEPKQTLGSDVWFRWRIDYYKNQGVEPRIALETALMDWVSVQSLTQVKLVEPGTDKIVQRIQDEGFHVMGLTTRGASLATRTTQQLKTIDIDLSRSAPTHNELLFLNPHEVIFKNGALFTSGTHKGKALFKFLDQINEQFSVDEIGEVVFINDKTTHLAQIRESCEERGIPFIGLRYGFSDERVNNFSEEIALYQFEQFGKILSDQEASEELSLPY